MVYNKTKRGLEKAAGIVGVVVGSIEVFASFVIIVLCMLTSVLYTYNYTLIAVLFIIFAFSMTYLILCALVIKSPVDANGNVKRSRKGIQVCLIVFSVLAGNLVVMGLEIAVVCMKDLVPGTNQQQNTYAQQNSYAQPKRDSVDSKIDELKRLKELGVIDDAVYNKAIEKIINDLK